MTIKDGESGKTWYELKDVIRIAQGFATGNQFTVLPNEVVTDIINEMERLAYINARALIITNSIDLVSIVKRARDSECGCTTCVELGMLVMENIHNSKSEEHETS